MRRTPFGSETSPRALTFRYFVPYSPGGARLRRNSSAYGRLAVARTIDDGTIESARRLWDQGKTLRQIGVALGRTPNSIVSIAHRYHFAPRPSPLRRSGSELSEDQKKLASQLFSNGAGARRIAASMSISRAAIERFLKQMGPQRAAPGKSIESSPKEAARPLDCEAIVPLRVSRTGSSELPQSGGCKWPVWAHQDRAPRPPVFCGAPREPGRPYCSDHCEVAYHGWQSAQGAAGREDPRPRVGAPAQVAAVLGFRPHGRPPN